MTTLSQKFRIWHRYLGFFLAGIMAVYALSGIVLIYRKTDTFKITEIVNRQLEPQLTQEQLREQVKVRIRNLSQQDGTIYFNKDGRYDRQTGKMTYTHQKLPYLLKQMNKLHKATTNSPIYWLNIFFGVALLFFSVSAFFMFAIQSKAFKKSMWYAVGGFVLTIILLLW